MQRRRWGTNACLVATPFIFSMFLWALQAIINQQLSGLAYQCGCMCTSCCDLMPAPSSSTNGETCCETMIGQWPAGLKCCQPAQV